MSLKTWIASKMQILTYCAPLSDGLKAYEPSNNSEYAWAHGGSHHYGNSDQSFVLHVYILDTAEGGNVWKNPP